MPQETDPSAFVLAATDRLARQGREDANLQRAREGASVWEAPRIGSLSRWLIDTWTTSWPEAQLLGATQELVLWEEAVERDEAGRALLAPRAAAREARRADQWVRRYRIDLGSAPAWQDEHHAFRRWRAQVQKRLDANRWLTAADIPFEVERGLRSGEIAAPEAVRLEGFFDQPVPAERAVLEALAARGTRIEHAQAEPRVHRLRQLRPADDESQFRLVAHEIAERLRACPEHEPPPRILVALPDPESRRELLESVLRDLLAPWAARGEGHIPWRWERARPLAEQAWVVNLLDILQLAIEKNSPGLVSRVLLATTLWSDEALRSTAAADYALRRAGTPRLRLTRVAQELSEPLRARFAELQHLIASAPSRALPSDWAAHLLRRAEALGWPGPETQDSATFQAVRAARGLFERLATLDGLLGRVPLSTARDWLGELARASPFSPSVDHLQPVLITSLEEAASLHCDVLYVLDVAAAQVPAAARPTPFLPLELQRAAGIAESAPESALARARRVAEVLQTRCATEVTVLVPRVDARGAELQASSLYGKAGAWREVELATSLSVLERAIEAAPSLSWPETDAVPPIDASEQAGIRADSALFKAWFDSPFFAFCRYRLGIESLPAPARGVNAIVQGQLAHAVLEDFWAVVGDSRGLAALDSAQLGARLGSLIDAQLPRLLPTADFGAATVQLERARALDVIAQWLAHERRRVDAFRVELREAEARPVIAGLSLRLRLDRVDRVETPEGPRWLVIDYKTGREARPEGWKAERLAEPQLPLYASHAVLDVAEVPQVDGICFGHLKDGHPALVARTNWRGKLIEAETGKREPAWDALLAAWRAALDQAARGFLAGEAWVDADVSDRSYYAELLVFTTTRGDDP